MIQSAARVRSSYLVPVYPAALAACIVFAVWADTRMHPAGMYRSLSVAVAATPGRPGLFAERTTAVNVLPILLDAYLGTTTPGSPDGTYLWDPDTMSMIELHAPGE